MNDNNRFLGIALFALGIGVIALRFVDINFWSLAWPLWVILPGAGLLYAAFSTRPANVGFAIPGATVTGTGLILAALNISGHWEAWAYLWTLYPAFVGLAMFQVGRTNGEFGLEQAGRRVGTIGLYLLIGFGLFFELLIFGGGFGILNSSFLPIVLIAGGAYLMFSRNNISILPERKSKKRKVDVY